jgi:osmotically-inducible protein OsmY
MTLSLGMQADQASLIEKQQLESLGMIRDAYANGFPSLETGMQDMNDDQQTQQHVENALDWADPSIDASRIRVSVRAGIVTLAGYVSTDEEKPTAERVARLLYGVAGVVNELAVSPVDWLDPTDAWHNPTHGALA